MLPGKTFFKLYSSYLTNPDIIPEIVRREFIAPLMRRIGQNQPSEAQRKKAKQLATNWCEKVAVDLREVCKVFGIDSRDVKMLRELYPIEIETALNSENDCPFKLGGAANLDFLYLISEHLKVKNVLETGVAYGWSSLALLLSLQNRASGTLYSIDLPYFHLQNDEYVGCVIPHDLKRHWTLLRMADKEGLRKVVKLCNSFDLVHYDSDKSYTGRLSSYKFIWPYVREGGVLISDDVGDNFAFRDFAEYAEVSPLIMPYDQKYQGVVIKN